MLMQANEAGVVRQAGATNRVYEGIMAALEQGRMVPGQRLIETDLAQQFGVGRNAVREAMQQLAARGVVDLSRNRSPAIRILDIDETLEILDVASSLTALAAACAARHAQAADAVQLSGAVDLLAEADRRGDPPSFSRARRNFYRILLQTGRNRELQRLFPAIGMHIIYAQYMSPELRGIRLNDYRAIAKAVQQGDVIAAERAAHVHVDNVREVISRSP